ncbi:MAG: hypothetical protein V4479_07615 [Actinomycetota bacterium]
MLAPRYRAPLAALAVMLTVATCVLLLFSAIAHADPVGVAVTSPAVVQVTSWAMMLTALLGGIVGTLAAIGTALHFVAPRTKTTVDDRVMAVVDRLEAGFAEVLAAARAFVPGGTMIQELAPATPAPASPVTINLHPAAAPSAPASGTTTTTTVGPIAALLLFFALAAGAPGCAATTRADTLQTATLTVVAARDALLAYDGPHELELARTGTPDQAAAALTAYRAKRTSVNKAIAAAGDAIVLAGGLNDQPSLDGVARAIAQVIADYKALKGMP